MTPLLLYTIYYIRHTQKNPPPALSAAIFTFLPWPTGDATSAPPHTGLLTSGILPRHPNPTPETSRFNPETSGFNSEFLTSVPKPPLTIQYPDPDGWNIPASFPDRHKTEKGSVRIHRNRRIRPYKKLINPKKRISVNEKRIWIEIFLNFEMGGPLPRRPFLGPYFDECIFD